MIKLVPISSCAACPYVAFVETKDNPEKPRTYVGCAKLERSFEYGAMMVHFPYIPDWCTLENAENKK